MSKDYFLTIREKKLRYEKPWKTIFYFCFPTILLMLIQGFYNIVDKSLSLIYATPILSKNFIYINLYNKLNNFSEKIIPYDDMKIYINVGTQYATQIYNLLLSFCVMFGMGCAMNFSIFYGKRNFNKMKEISANGFTMTLLFSFFISFFVFCLIYPDWGAIFIRTQMGDSYNPITEKICWEYTYPLLLSSPLLFLSYYFISLIRSEGKMIFVTFIIISSLLINSLASIFFMNFFKLGVIGASIGTIISWFFQVFLSFLIIFCSKNSYIKFLIKDIFKLKLSNFYLFIISGMPSFITNIALVITSFISTILVSKLPISNFEKFTSNNISVLQQLYSSITPWMTIILSTRNRSDPRSKNYNRL